MVDSIYYQDTLGTPGSRILLSRYNSNKRSVRQSWGRNQKHNPPYEGR